MSRSGTRVLVFATAFARSPRVHEEGRCRRAVAACHRWRRARAPPPPRCRRRRRLRRRLLRSPPAAPGAAAPAAGPGGSITGKIELPAALAKTKPQGTLFLVARRLSDNPSARGTLIAVKKMPATKFPLAFDLSAADMPFQNGAFDGELTLTARIDQDGDPMSHQKGDVLGHAAEGAGRLEERAAARWIRSRRRPSRWRRAPGADGRRPPADAAAGTPAAGAPAVAARRDVVRVGGRAASRRGSGPSRVVVIRSAAMDYKKLRDMVSHRVTFEYDSGSKVVGYVASCLPPSGAVQMLVLSKVQVLDGAKNVIATLRRAAPGPEQPGRLPHHRRSALRCRGPRRARRCWLRRGVPSPARGRITKWSRTASTSPRRPAALKSTEVVDVGGGDVALSRATSGCRPPTGSR